MTMRWVFFVKQTVENCADGFLGQNCSRDPTIVVCVVKIRPRCERGEFESVGRGANTSRFTIAAVVNHYAKPLLQ